MVKNGYLSSSLHICIPGARKEGSRGEWGPSSLGRCTRIPKQCCWSHLLKNAELWPCLAGGGWEMRPLISWCPLTLGAVTKQGELQGMGGRAASGTHAHQLLFHLAKAGPRQVGGMHAGQAQGRNCPQMRRGSRVGLIWEEEGGAWRAGAGRGSLGDRRGGEMEGSGAHGAAPPKEASSPQKPQETHCPEPAKQGPHGEPKPLVPVALAQQLNRPC